MTRRPTAKAGIIAAIGGVLVVVGTTAQAGWLFVLAAGVLGLAVSGLLASQRVASARVGRVLPDRERPRVGDIAETRLILENPTSRRLPVMRVEDEYPAFEPVAVACESVPPGGAAEIKFQRVAVWRGVFDGGDVVLTTAAPFGLARTKRKGRIPTRLIVHPRWGKLSGFELPETPAATADEALAVARAGHGDVFAGVREYRPGDPRKSVHWRTTARTGRLVVREHEEPARSPVVVVVTGPPEDAEHPGWEESIVAAASAGVHALSLGRPVHCVGPGHFGPYLDDVGELQLLDWCAGLDPNGMTHEEAVAGAFRRWGRRCSFLLFSIRLGAAEEAVRLATARGAGSLVIHSGPPKDGS